MTMTSELAAYLERLGLRTPPPPTFAGLRAVHRAHVARIPYDNLSIMLGRPDSVGQGACVERVVSGNRLGYCFHQNSAFEWLLTTLGFTVSRRGGHIDSPPERPIDDSGLDHLALVVSGLPTTENPGGHWWADAGLGEGFSAPLPLTRGHHHLDGWSFGITALVGDGPPRSLEGPSGWQFRHRPGGTPATLAVTSRDHDWAAVSRAHQRLSLGAASRFRRKLVVLLNEGGRLLAVRGCIHTEVRPDGRAQRDLTTFDEWRRVMVDALLLPLHDVDDQELQTLWAQTLASHRAWDAAGRP